MAMEDATRIKYATDGLVLRSIASGTEHALQGEMLVGREVECAITLGSGQASRYHAKINVSAHGVYIEDLHSTNGTFINGKKSRGRIRLSIGDEVTFDTVAFRLASKNSGQEDVTALAPRRLTTQPVMISVPSQDLKSKPRPEQPPQQGSEPPQAQPINPAISIPSHSSPIEPAKPKPITAPVSPEWHPEDIEFDEDIDESRTQMMSSTHMNRLVERNRSDININIGTGPRLIVMTAPLRGKVFSLDDVEEGSRWQVGRSIHSDVQLNDKTISMDHARLSRTPKGYILTSTHAKNAILINGEKQKQAFLEHDDKIQIGRTELLFRTDDSPVDKDDVEAMPYEELRNHRFTLISTIAIVLVIVIAIITTAK